MKTCLFFSGPLMTLGLESTDSSASCQVRACLFMTLYDYASADDRERNGVGFKMRQEIRIMCASRLNESE